MEHSYCGFLVKDEIEKGLIFRRSRERGETLGRPPAIMVGDVGDWWGLGGHLEAFSLQQSWWGRWGLVALKVGMAVTEGGEGRQVLRLCSLTKKELWGHSRVLHGWRLGTGNRVYPSVAGNNCPSQAAYCLQ